MFIFVVHLLCCRYQPRNGHQLVRHRQHPAGTGDDEVLEGQAHHPQEAGKSLSLRCWIVFYGSANALLPSTFVLLPMPRRARI